MTKTLEQIAESWFPCDCRPLPSDMRHAQSCQSRRRFTCVAAMKAAVEQERERCARFIETHTTNWGASSEVIEVDDPGESHRALAAAIRALGSGDEE